MIVGIIVGGIFLFIILFLFVVLILLYHYIFYSPLKGQLSDFNIFDSPNFAGYQDNLKNLITSLKERKHEDVYAKSYDNLKLHARLYENSKSQKVAILFHGYRGTALRDFCGGAKEAIELGYSVILVDQRAHGSSEGHSITFGVREVNDVLTWVDFVKQRFGKDTSLVLVGISMGGATVLGACDKVGDNVKIIADSPYPSPKVILSASIRSVHLPTFIFYPLINLAAILFAHTNMNNMSAYKTIENTNNKILIIHGTKDSVVPYETSKKLAETFLDKIQYELFEGADHGVSYLADTKRYCDIVREFLS